MIPDIHKTVIVTGGSQGIGAGLVKAFLDRRYNVVATSRSITKTGAFKVSEAIRRDRRAGEQCRNLFLQRVHGVHGRRSSEAHIGEHRRVSFHHTAGERYGGIKDPCGNIWWVAAHVEDVPPDEQERRWRRFQMP
jgi:NAD(P)-dependent dehydrogenase (short-subunit alcohol dehydrogenase family)